MRRDSVLTAPRRKAERGGAKNSSPLRWLALAPRRPRFYAAAVARGGAAGHYRQRCRTCSTNATRHPSSQVPPRCPPDPGALARRGAGDSQRPPLPSPARSSAPGRAAEPGPPEPRRGSRPRRRHRRPRGGSDRRPPAHGRQAKRFAHDHRSPDRADQTGLFLKADGAAGPIRPPQLRDFEKSRGLTLSTEITQHWSASSPRPILRPAR